MTVPRKAPLILNVDDRELNRYLRTQALASAGFEILEASTGAEAFEIAFRERPHLVLMDVNLPDADGIDICRKIKKDPRMVGTMVLQISASAIGISDAIRGLEGGADGYLVEPIEADLLIAHVRSLLRLRDSEMALHESESQLILALNAAKMCTWNWDIDTGKVRWRGSGTEIFGVDPQQTIPDIDHFWKWVHPEDSPSLQKQVQAVIDSGSPYYHAEYRIVRQDGEVRWLEATGEIAYQVADRHARMFGVVADITVRKGAEIALRQANADLQQFAFAVGHDLQGPIRTVRVFSELLARHLGSDIPEAAKEHLTTVVGGANAMQMLVASLLSFAQAGQVPPEPPPAVSLEDSARAAIANLQGLLQESGATVEVDALPTLPVWTDQITQVFQNLISNAVKYRRPDEPPSIRISAHEQGDSWVIGVYDNGQGFEPEYAERIFGVFKRLHGSDVPGTGLGLAICRRIIERHGGTIWAQSQAGRGSTFFFRLPRRATIRAAGGQG